MVFKVVWRFASKYMNLVDHSVLGFEHVWIIVMSGKRTSWAFLVKLNEFILYIWILVKYWNITTFLFHLFQLIDYLFTYREMLQTLSNTISLTGWNSCGNHESQSIRECVKNNELNSVFLPLIFLLLSIENNWSYIL